MEVSMVNAHLIAIDDFYRHVGLGPAVVKRQELPKAVPRALADRARLRGGQHRGRHPACLVKTRSSTGR
jgi:hypothetical protein